MDLTKLNTIVNQFGTAFIDKMKADLAANNSVATGELSKSLRFNYNINGDNIIIKFLSEDYSKYVEQGRLAGKFPPISAIKKWCTIKGFPESAAYPITKHIQKFGIKPKPFIFKNYESLKEEFIISLIAAYGSLVEIDIISELNEIPKTTTI